MPNYLLPATPEDMRLLADILREARQKPFEFHNCDREEKIIALEKKWLVPTRQQVEQSPCISPKSESNQLRVEVEDGREPSEIQLNQTISKPLI